MSLFGDILTTDPLPTGGTGGTGTPDPGWSVTAGYTETKTLDPENTTTTQLARVVGTLVDALTTYGILVGPGDGTPNPGWGEIPAFVPTRTLDPEDTYLTEIARVVGTLIDALKTYGALAP